MWNLTKTQATEHYPLRSHRGAQKGTHRGPRVFPREPWVYASFPSVSLKFQDFQTFSRSDSNSRDQKPPDSLFESFWDIKKNRFRDLGALGSPCGGAPGIPSEPLWTLEFVCFPMKIQENCMFQRAPEPGLPQTILIHRSGAQSRSTQWMRARRVHCSVLTR